MINGAVGSPHVLHRDPSFISYDKSHPHTKLGVIIIANPVEFMISHERYSVIESKYQVTLRRKKNIKHIFVASGEVSWIIFTSSALTESFVIAY